MVNRVYWLGSVLAMAGTLAGCRRGSDPPAAPPPPGTGDAAFVRLTHEVLDDYDRRYPTTATDLGIHDYDDRLEDYSAAAVAVEVRTLRGFRSRLDAVDPTALTLDNQLDREWLIHSLDSLLLEDETIRTWEKDPDHYSSGITTTAYVMAKRPFAPPDVRMRHLVSRLRLMPAALEDARRNLRNPPRVYTEIAIEQIDGNIDFFKTSLPAAFNAVGDAALRADFDAANKATVDALVAYKTWLTDHLLAESKGDFAYGSATYRTRLWNDEMIDTPLAELLAMARADLAKNQAAFAATAHFFSPQATAAQVLASLQQDHPPSSRLIEVTQGQLDGLADFLAAHEIVTLPDGVRAQVKETPPFMRATTSASMDIPGPFETVATEAYYNMTLPDPSWPAKEQDEFMKQWYEAAISNVSVHEVWPGHYVQFLYARQLTSDVRKVFTANSNTEGWAHYAEEMMMQQGLHSDDPRYRLAQLQDALLRDVRFIVGIEMHTRGLSVADAEKMFERDAYQPAPVAESEAKRGTSDATYGYYTMGKLMILKLREDYRAKMGADYSLEGFHDAFMRIGGLPIPLVRRAMLGSTGTIFPTGQ